MGRNIKITRLHDKDSAIAKRISWDGNKLIKESKASVNNGYAESQGFTWDEFKDYLNSMPTDDCIVLGDLKHGDSCEIVGHESVQDPSQNMYNRSLKNFGWHQDYQLCCIDFDDSKVGNLTPEEVIEILDEVMSGFKNITKVIKYSSSAWIHDKDGNLLSGTNGFHIYFLVNNPEKIKDFFGGAESWLCKKLWNAGYGYIKNSNPKDRKTTAVTQMIRTLYDYFVFSPERIIFEAPPILEDGLYKTNTKAILLEGERDFLDLSQYEDITEQEEKTYNKLVEEAKLENENSPYMIESRAMFEHHVREKIKAGNYKNKVEYQGLSEDDIVKREFKASRAAILMQDHVIELASGEFVTVEDILNDPDKYHEQSCKDPHEPDYGNSSISIIYTEQNVPIIFSHAHGGITYRLKSDDQPDEPDYYSEEYWLDHFYMVAYDKKNEVYHVNGNKIEHFGIEGFRNRFAGYSIDVGDDEKPKIIPMTKWWINNKNKKCISDDNFAPDQPIIYYKHGELVINEYVPEILRYGFKVPRKEEYLQHASLWVDHVKKMIHDPEEAEVILDWFAFLIQRPEERPMFSPLIISETRGVGKDMMTDIFTRMLGYRFAKKSTIEELSKSDGWGDVFHQSKLITVSECGSSTDRYTVGNTIKDNITTTHKQMNLKGRKIVDDSIYAGIIFFSNITSPFRFDEGDRRFFVTRCDWNKKQADQYKMAGYFKELASYYAEPEHLNGLYHFLLNREIGTDLKGDAPMTSTKEIMMNSEPNEIEQFFVDLKKHPCKYWTKRMIIDLYRIESSDIYDDINDNKQFKHFLNQMVDVGRLKVKGGTHRIKTFSVKEADCERKEVRKHIQEHWDVTTGKLHPYSDSESMYTNVLEVCSVDAGDSDTDDVEYCTVTANEEFFKQERSRLEGITT